MTMIKDKKIKLRLKKNREKIEAKAKKDIEKQIQKEERKQEREEKRKIREKNMYIDSPYKKLPKLLERYYTMNGKIPIIYKYHDNSKKNGIEWNRKLIDSYIKKFTPENIKQKKEGFSGNEHEYCFNLLKALNRYEVIKKNVAVVGSEKPWIESILLNMKNNVTTIEYNVPKCNYKNLRCKSYFEYFENNKDEFDVIITLSSIQHSGLGRYGEKLDPNGDLKTIENIHNNLTKNGILIWGAPIGKDVLCWNSHRVYGKIRLPLMFRKFTEIEWFSNKKKQELFDNSSKKDYYEPVIVLKKKMGSNERIEKIETRAIIIEEKKKDIIGKYISDDAIQYLKNYADYSIDGTYEHLIIDDFLKALLRDHGRRHDETLKKIKDEKYDIWIDIKKK